MKAKAALFRLFLVLFSLGASLTVPASAFSAELNIPRDDAEQMIKIATDRLLQISREARSYAAEDPDRYNSEIKAVLDQVIDRQYFARGVMATYASARQYKALQTEEERLAFRARVERFADALDHVLLVKYADALLAFNGERIEVSGIFTGDEGSSRTNIQQIIHAANDKTYTVQYNLHQGKDGKWLIYNVIVEGVNLGSVLRSQFAEAVEKNRGDVDYVVNNWTRLMLEQEQKK